MTSYCLKSPQLVISMYNNPTNDPKYFPAQPGEASCSTMRAEALKSSSKFVPNCQKDGSYASKQCIGSGFHKWCWCTNPIGHQVPETLHKVAQPVKPDCDRHRGKANKIILCS